MNQTGKSYDIVIVGGGIHGVGIAQAAAAAGYRVLLLEKDEIGGATSSRSSKLIHGGLRYLESGQYSLVRECLKDRGTLLRIAPDLVRLVPFYIPVYKNTTRSCLKLSLGLGLYALLGALGSESLFTRFTPKQWENQDRLDTHELSCVLQYWDAQTDDAALTRAVARSAKKLGAHLVTHANVTRIVLDNEDCQIIFQQGENQLRVHAHCVVNASGPWLNYTLGLVSPQVAPLSVDLVQGSHILVDRTQSKGVYYLESPSDRRAVFSMPWKQKTLLGTTEISYVGDPDKTTPSATEKDYLVSIYNHYFPDRAISQADIIESFSGLRVLPHDQSAMFSRLREMSLATFPQQQPKLVSVVGGKLTAYLSTAEKTLEEIHGWLPKRKRVADPRKIGLHPLNTDYV